MSDLFRLTTRASFLVAQASSLAFIIAGLEKLGYKVPSISNG